MKTDISLPNGYAQSEELRVSGAHRLLNACSFLCSAALIALGWLWRSFDALTGLLRQGFGNYYLWILLLIAAIYLYQIAHVATHGLFLRLFSGRSAMYVRRGISLFVGSDAYFSRGQMLAVNLLPMLLWGAVGLACAAFLQGIAFWFAYICMILNLGGSMNDVYFALKLCRRPKHALYQYRGYAVRVFTEESA